MSTHNVEADWRPINQAESRKRERNRLSQRRHRAKLRQQAPETSIPSEALDINGQFFSDGYLDLSLDMATLAGPVNASTHQPNRTEWETNRSICAMEGTASHPPNMYRATQLSPNRWAIPPQIMSSGDILTTGYPASARFPAGDTSSIASSSISPKPRGLSTESWNIGAVSESQWTQTRDLGPSRPSVLTYGGVEDGEPGQQSNQRPTNTYGGYQPQPPPRPERQRTALQQPQYDDEESPSPEPEQMHLGRTNKKRMRGKCQYTGTQGLQVDLDQPLPHMDSASRQGRHGSSSKAPSPDAYAPSPVPNMHTQPSRCHCGTSDPSRKYHTRTTTPSTTASSPKSDIAQPKPHRRFSSYADLSPDDQLTLRNLVQHNMPARKQHRILTRSSWRPTKSRKYSSTDSSSLDEPSLDDQLGTGQGIEKVVIVYLRDGEKVA